MEPLQVYGDVGPVVGSGVGEFVGEVVGEPVIVGVAVVGLPSGPGFPHATLLVTGQ